MATIANLTVDQGADFSATVNLQNLDATFFVLTGYTVKAQMARSYASSTKTTITTVVNNAATGEIILSLTNTQTTALEQGRYVYDVEITQTSSGTKTRVIEGQITVYPQVTSI
jgi:hypothetical protein|tara:strand:- start:512 stop:850 length:339 start_codon:yes stop_codon:yes gene_type:complete